MEYGKPAFEHSVFDPYVIFFFYLSISISGFLCIFQVFSGSHPVRKKLRRDLSMVLLFKRLINFVICYLTPHSLHQVFNPEKHRSIRSLFPRLRTQHAECWYISSDQLILFAASNLNWIYVLSQRQVC